MFWPKKRPIVLRGNHFHFRTEYESCLWFLRETSDLTLCDSFGICQQHCSLVHCTGRHLSGSNFLLQRVSTVSSGLNGCELNYCLQLLQETSDLTIVSSFELLSCSVNGDAVLFLMVSSGYFLQFLQIVCSSCRGPLTCQQCSVCEPPSTFNIALFFKGEREIVDGNKTWKQIIAATNTGQKMREFWARNYS